MGYFRRLSFGQSGSSVTQSYLILCGPIDCSMTGLPVHHQLPEPPQSHVNRVGDLSNNLILWCPLLLPPSIFPSIKVFSNVSTLHSRWPKYWSVSLASVLPMNNQDWFPLRWTLDLPAVQGTLKSLLQHHNSKASILWHSGFFIVQLSHPYMTIGKTIALTRQIFVGKCVWFLTCCLGWS